MPEVCHAIRRLDRVTGARRRCPVVDSMPRWPSKSQQTRNVEALIPRQISPPRGADTSGQVSRIDTDLFALRIESPATL